MVHKNIQHDKGFNVTFHVSTLAGYSMFHIIRVKCSLKHTLNTSFCRFNPFMPNGISHFYQFDQSISVIRVVGLLFKFQ